MTSLFFGQLTSTGVPADAKVVRTTATPVDRDAPAAVADDMPQMQEVETDPNPALGMVTRQLASKWVQGEHTPPPYQGVLDDGPDHNYLIDKQVSTSGLAARREAAGERGPGTLSFAVGIEPVGDLTEGGKMGNSYFARNERNVQAGMGNYMTPVMGDQDTTARVAWYGKDAARDAAQAALYTAFWNGGNPL